MLHVISQASWAAARAHGAVVCPAGGFIHLCTNAQLGFVLDRHFAGRQGLVVLTVDPAGLDMRWEASEPDMPPFPHLYGDLPCRAVIGERPL